MTPKNKEGLSDIMIYIAIVLMVALAVISAEFGYKIGKVQGHNKAMNECRNEIGEIPLKMSSIILSSAETLRLYAECKVDEVKREAQK